MKQRFPPQKHESMRNDNWGNMELLRNKSFCLMIVIGIFKKVQWQYKI